MRSRASEYLQRHRLDRSPWRMLLVALVMSLCAIDAGAQAPAAAPGVVPPPALSDQELQSLVGRIALYPDDLVAIVLPASTFPIQIVQADRFLQQRKSQPTLAVDERWDDSVKALLNYPDVVKLMSDDLDWTTALGNAVVENQAAVLEAIQAFRRAAQAAGNLKTDDKQVVQVQQQVIQIVPADPQVIYVPQYNPATVVYYSPAPVFFYWPTPYPVYYYPYPPGSAFVAGMVWGAAIGAAWNGGRYSMNYGRGYGNVNINYNNNRTVNVNRPGQPARPGGGGTAWTPNRPSGSVGRPGGQPNAPRVGDPPRPGAGGGSGSPGAPGGRPGGGGSSGAGGAPGGGRPSGGAASGGQPGAGGPGSGGGTARPSSPVSGGGAARPSTPATGGGAARPTTPATGGGASRPTTPAAGAGAVNRGSSSRDAFAGYGSGSAARNDSSRGAASRSTISSAPTRSAPSGGARGGGGGARGGAPAGGRGR